MLNDKGADAPGRAALSTFMYAYVQISIIDKCAAG
jgi:hypothetical protein